MLLLTKAGDFNVFSIDNNGRMRICGGGEAMVILNTIKGNRLIIEYRVKVYIAFKVVMLHFVFWIECILLIKLFSLRFEISIEVVN